MERETTVILSLGAGVQSTVMALMCSRGELPYKVSAAIFSDTGWEPAFVYDHLEWLKSQLTFPVHIVSNGNLRKDFARRVAGEGRAANIPLFVRNPDGKTGIIMRQCTNEYKITPVNRKVRELIGVSKGKRVPKHKHVLLLMGISTDEIVRMKESKDAWKTLVYPLIDARMSREDCIAWFARNYPGRSLAKSSCIGCPFHDNAAWLQMYRQNPKDFEDACEFDDMLRANGTPKGFNGDLFLHRSLRPLRELPFLKDDAQREFGFLEECEGMCGV